MKKLLKREHGNVMVLTAASLMAIFSLAALAIDTGYMWTAKNQLQSAVDAATLAGAAGLLESQSEAIARALQIAAANDVAHQSIVLSPQNITFPTITRIQIQASQTIRLFFAPVIGINTTTLSASASAEITNIVGTRGARPWALPNLGTPVGTEILVKAGGTGAPGTTPSFFYPICYPPVNKGNPKRGANVYRENIANGSEDIVELGDELMVEPGNMVGPTSQGVAELLELDPDAFWNGQKVVESAYPGFSSPRIIKIPLFDPDFPPSPGRGTITVNGWIAVFITGLKGKDVMGVVIEMATTGIAGTPESSTTLYGVRLVG